MADFTNGEVFLSYLSSVWTQMFTGCTGVMQGISHANALYLLQLYQDWVEAVDRLSIRRIHVFHRELVYPIVLRKPVVANEANALRFGEGAVFGSQPKNSTFPAGEEFSFGSVADSSGFYYVTLPQQVAGLGRVILNRLINASVVLARDSQWNFQDGVISFKDDPFANPLIPQRQVAGDDGTIENEIVLWAVDADIERFNVYNQFGFAFTSQEPSGEFYKEAIRMTMELYAGGPTPQMVDSFVAALAQAPMTSEATETVQKIDSFQNDILVVTDTNVYRVPAGMALRPNIVPGAVLLAGQPLTTATTVTTRQTDPLWWNSLPFLTVTKDLVAADITFLGFVNDGVEVSPGKRLVSNDGSKTGNAARFLLVGNPADVEKFWAQSDTQSAAQGVFLGDSLWKSAGLINPDGSPDFTKELYLNPLQLFADLVGDALVIVNMALSSFNNSVPLFQNLKLLRETLPAWCAVIIFIDVELNEQYSLESIAPDGVEVLTAIPVSIGDLIRGAVDNFDSTTRGYFVNLGTDGLLKTRVPEALSVDDSPDIIRETLDFGDPDAHGTGIPVCSEEVRVSTIKTCN